MRDIASHYITLITFSVLSKRRVYLNDFCGKMNFIYVTHVTFLGVTIKPTQTRTQIFRNSRP